MQEQRERDQAELRARERKMEETMAKEREESRRLQEERDRRHQETMQQIQDNIASGKAEPGFWGHLANAGISVVKGIGKLFGF